MSSAGETNSTGRRSRVARVLHEYLAALRAGNPPSITEMVEKHPELAGEIETCLESLEFVRRAAATASSPRQQEELRQETLGDFRILRETGRGGMGVVYEAEQISLGRRVALKTFPFAPMLDPRQLQRFKNEARAAATLDHPNIVHVHTVGCERGVHYYAMQYIDGQTLAEVIRELRQLAGLDAAAHGEGGASQLTLDFSSGRLGDQPPRGSSLCQGEAEDAVRQQVGHETDQTASGSPPDSGPSPDRSAPGSGGRGQVSDVHGAKSGSNEPSAETGPNLQASISTAHGGTNRREFFRSVARLGIQAAKGLEHAHQMGVVHRDVKPSNLLLDAGGRVWITDFGVAITRADPNLTISGDGAGTLRYMSPEQALGEHGVLDHRTDIYSLGATLYELITLQPAFSEDDPQRILHDIAEKDPRRPRHHNRATPADLETIVLKAMAKDPFERYATAHELAADLERFLADRPVRARRTGAAERTWQWCRRNPIVAGLEMTLVALLLTGIVVSTVFLIWSRYHERTAKESLLNTLIDQATAACSNPTAGQRFGSLRALKPAAGLVSELGLGNTGLRKVREAALPLMALPDLRVTGRPWKRPEGAKGGWFSPDLTRCVIEDRQGNLSIRQAADGNEAFSLPSPGPRHGDPVFSRDGHLLAQRYLLDNKVVCYVWDLEACAKQTTGSAPIHKVDSKAERTSSFVPDGDAKVEGTVEEKELFAPVGIGDDDPAGEAQSPVFPVSKRDGKGIVFKVRASRGESTVDFSADGRWIAVGGPDRRICVCDVRAGELLHSIARTRISRQLCFHPNERRLAVLCAGCSRVDILDLDKKEGIAAIQYPEEVQQIAWRPDGKLLAAASLDFHIYVWNIEANRPQSLLEGHQGEVMALSFNHAGDVLASRSLDGTTRLWDPVAARELVRVDGDFQRFSSDDRRLAFRLGDTIGFWELAECECRTLHVLAGGVQGLYGVACSPNGRLMATAGDDGVRLWDVVSGRDIALLPLDDTGMLVFSNDGRGMVTSSLSGVQIWPIDESRDDTHARIGPPTTLHRPTSETLGVPVCAMHDGLLAAITGDGEIRVRRRHSPTETVMQGGHRNVAFVSVGPNGKWIATGAREGAGVRVWDAHTGELVKELLPDSSTSQVAFSPDGHWLVASTRGAYQFWDVGSWTPGQRIALEHAQVVGPIAFSPDGRVLVIAHSRSTVDLIDVTTGEPLGSLQSPDPIELSDFCFSCDGGQLLTVSMNRRIQLWDLRGLRQRLAAMGLDWNLPALPPGLKPTDQPLSVTLVLHERDPMESAAASSYREHEWDTALTAHKRSMARRFAGNGYDWFLMAMIQWQLGEKQAARKWYDLGDEWLATAGPQRMELRRLSNEAADLLGVAPPATSSQSSHARRPGGQGGADLSVAGGQHGGTETRDVNKSVRRTPLLPIVPNPKNGHFYQRIDVPMSWHDAKKDCESRGGHLATVASAEENKFIYRKFAKDHVCWLGGTDEIEEGTWRWVTGEPFAYHNWFSNEPSNFSHEEHSDEDYLVLGNARFPNGADYHYAFGSQWNDHAGHGRFFGNDIAYPLCEWEWDDQGGTKPDHLPRGLLLYMTFEQSTVAQNAGTTIVEDMSGAGNHAIGKGVAFTPDGRIGRGLAIQGGTLLLARTLLDKRAEYTIVAWVKKASAKEDLILYREYADYGPILYELDFIEAVGRMRVKCWNRHKQDHWVHVDFPARIGADQWHFVAITLKDGAVGRGKLTLSLDDKTFTHEFQMLHLQSQGYGSLGAGTGELDEVAFFDRALSQEEIRSLYKKGRPQQQKGDSDDRD